MFRSLLTLMLVLPQLASASACPLYLCIACDGTVCLDVSPTKCGCCREADDENAASDDECCCGTCNKTCEHGQLAGDRDESASSVCSVSDPCKCTHLPISRGQDGAAATTLRGSAYSDGWLAFGFSNVHALAVAADSALRPVHSVGPDRLYSDRHSLALILLRTTRLTC